MVDRSARRRTRKPGPPKMSLVAETDMTPHRIPRAQAIGLTVGEVMIARPKTLPGDALVRDVQLAFERSSGSRFAASPG